MHHTTKASRSTAATATSRRQGERLMRDDKILEIYEGHIGSPAMVISGTVLR